MTLLLAFTACTSVPKTTLPAPVSGAGADGVLINKAGSEANIEKSLVAGKINIVEFYAEW
jgi:hypothetical protein